MLTMRVLIRNIYQNIQDMNGMILCVWLHIANIIGLYGILLIAVKREN